MRYIALVDGKVGAYGMVVPDLPDCTSAGSTKLTNDVPSQSKGRATKGESRHSGQAQEAVRDILFRIETEFVSRCRVRLPCCHQV